MTPDKLAAIIALLHEDKPVPQTTAPPDWPPIMDVNDIVEKTGLARRKAEEIFNREDFPRIFDDRYLVGREQLWLYLNGMYWTQRKENTS
jgi:hypothetical protein